MKLYELTISQLNSLLENNKTNVVEITKSIINRISKVESVLDCYISVFEDKAIKRAESIQNKIESGQLQSPIAGIPMALKDNICTKDMLTTCASKMLSNFISPYNATVVENLYENGAILLGKTNMDEFAMGTSTENSYFKKTRNPWDINRVPGGSSGGSAAAVASGTAVYSLGSDTGGSLRQPAAFCGVVGLKPTYGAVSRYGLIAYASSFDQIGPITKDVTDCALVLNSIIGKDQNDATSANIKHPNYADSLVNDVKGLRIGIPVQFMNENISEEVRKAVVRAIEILRNLGAQCEEISLPTMDYVLPTYCTLTFAEASSNLGRYDGVKYGYRTNNYNDLDELYKCTRDEGFGEEVKRRVILGTYVLSSGGYERYYKKALQVRRLICDEINENFEKYDIILGPTAPNTAFKFGVKVDDPIDMYKNDILTMPANIAGIPAITIPCGKDNDNLPIGLQMMSKQFNESILLRAAYTFEQNTEFHKNRPVI